MNALRELVRQVLIETINKSIKAFHTSPRPLSTLSSEPMWFSVNRTLARAYHENTLESRGDAHTYSVALSGNVISESQLKRLCKNLNIDHEELITDLVGNPDDAMSIPGIVEIAKHCDGFYHTDYDPRDSSNDSKVIFVFDPSKTVTIINEEFNKKLESKTSKGDDIVSTILQRMNLAVGSSARSKITKNVVKIIGARFDKKSKSVSIDVKYDDGSVVDNVNPANYEPVLY